MRGQRMKKLAFIFLVFIVVPFLTGCPGNSRQDKEVQAALWEWIQEEEINGWTIIGWETTSYTNVIIEHEFRPTRLRIVIDPGTMNPFHQRNWIETIVRQWRNTYPANMRPRFKLKVELFDMQMTSDHNIGWSEINQDGRVETHHSGTQDMI